MRLLEEQSRLEKRVEESERRGEEVELRLEDELCSVRSRLAAKEEVDSPSSFVQATEQLGIFSAIFSFFRSFPRPGSSWRSWRAGG